VPDHRHVQLKARARAVFEGRAGDGWLEDQGPWTYTINERGHAAMRSPTLTIADDGRRGIEWYIERNGRVGHGHRTALGAGRSVSRRLDS